MKATTAELVRATVRIATSRIKPDPDQPRKDFDPAYIARLGKAIQTEGLLQPITVRKDPAAPGHYLIITGECRWRAHCLMQIQAIECRVSRGLEEPRHRGRVQLMENTARAQMTLRDEAFAFQRQSDMGDSDQEIADSVGYTAYVVRNVRKLTTLSKEVWMHLDKGTIQRTVAEWTMGNVPEGCADGLLLKCAGLTRDKAMVVIDRFMLEQRQVSFDLAMEEAGVSGRKAELEQSLVEAMLKFSSVVASLSTKDQTSLALQLAEKAAEQLHKGDRSKRAAKFLSKSFIRIEAMM